MTCGEYTLSKKIFDAEENIRDDDCYIVDSWEKSLAANKSIFLETSFGLDVNGGNDNAADMAKDKAAEDVVINNEEAGKLKKQMVDVEEGMMKLTKTMENGFERLGNLVDGLDKRVKRVEELVKYQGWDGETDMGFESVSCRPSRYWNDAGGSGSGGGLENDKECTDGGGLEKDKEGVDGGGDGAEKDKDDGGGLEKDKEGADGGGDGLEKNKDDGGGLEKDKEVDDGGGSGVEKDKEDADGGSAGGCGGSGVEKNKEDADGGSAGGCGGYGVEKDKEDADGGSAGGEHFEEAVEEFKSCDSENNEEGDSETDEESEQENDEKGKGKEIVGEKRSRKPSKFEIDPYTRIRTVKRRKKKKPSSLIPLKL